MVSFFNEGLQKGKRIQDKGLQLPNWAKRPSPALPPLKQAIVPETGTVLAVHFSGDVFQSAC